MNGTAFIVLCGVTVIAIAGAGYAVNAQRIEDTIPRPTQTSVLPQVAQDPGDVAKVEVSTPSYKLDLQKKGTSWVDLSRGGYPVRAAAVTSLVTSLAALKPLEPKTTDPSLYSLVGVEDFKPGATSTLIDLAVADGRSVGDLIIGQRSSALSYDPLGGTFVRKPGDAQTWLAQGAAALPPQFSDWFEDIPSFPGTAVQQVTVIEGGKTVFDAKKDGITYHLVSFKGTPVPDPAAAKPVAPAAANAAAPDAAAATPAAATPATAATPPAPAAPAPVANDSAVKHMVEAIVSGTFDDVEPDSKVDFSKGRIVRYLMNNGITIESQLGTADGQEDWERLIPTASAGATPDQVKQAATLAAQTKGWAYKLADYQLTALKLTLADLTAPPPDINDVAGPGGLPGGMPGGPGGPLAGAQPGQQVPPEVLQQLLRQRQQQLSGQGGAPSPGQ